MPGSGADLTGAELRKTYRVLEPGNWCLDANLVLRPPGEEQSCHELSYIHQYVYYHANQTERTD
jgi:hypothetical protein